MSQRIEILAVLLVAALTGWGLAVSADEATSGDRSPQARAAEEEFFAVFNGEPRRREGPLRNLMIAWLGDRQDGRTALLLGLNHLWLAAEGDRTNPRLVEHLLLSERFLSQAQELLPEDERIASWLLPVRLALAEDVGERESLMDELMAAYRQDPNFHSFSVALQSFSDRPGTQPFERGLAALRSATGGCNDDPGDVSCLNRPRWPHNQEGYLTFFADYELKAGHPQRARELLLATRSAESFSRWPFRDEAEDRLENLELYAELFANDDPGDDPPTFFTGGSRIGCQVCHLGASD
ncbi:MAG: hypothetical protein AAF481_00865 [Acidobacteriota bacterium]